MAEAQYLLDGFSFGESLRWHQDRLWLADWGAQEVVAVDREGQPEVMARVDFPAFPMCIDWLPDGHLLVVAARRPADASRAGRVAGDPRRLERPG